MTPLFKKFLGINWLLFLNMMGLLVWGIYGIDNASGFYDNLSLANKWRDQTQWGMAGLVVFFGAALVDYKWARWGALPLYVSALGLELAVKVIGLERNGAKSWISIGGGSTIQPSQMAIVSGIIILAVVLGDLHRVFRSFRHHWLRLIVSGILTAIPMLMVLKEPDLGSAAVWGPVFISMLLVGSMPFRYLIVMGLLVFGMAVPIAYNFGLKPYQKKRVEVFINMVTNQKVDIQGDAYMADKIQIAVGSAGFEGKGPLSEKVPGRHSIHRTFYSDVEAMSDFIFSVIVEEFGFRGGVLHIAGMALLLLQCVFVAFYARDQLGCMLVVGVVGMMFAHTMQHVGMNILMMPITGLPMPFTSYGGTFLVMCMFLMGMVQSVWIHRNINPVKKKKGQEEEDPFADDE